MTSNQSLRRLQLFGLILIAVLVLLFILLPTSDPAHYFEFADRRSLFGINNIADVVSNFSFFIVGILGLLKWQKNRVLLQNSSIQITNQIHFQFLISIAIIWTGYGSAYFHSNPGLETVFWDRLPMAIVFSAVVGWLVADKINFKWGTLTAATLSIGGALSLLLWKWDIYHLKPYYLLQYGGLFAALLLCVLFPKGHYPNSKFFLTFAVYILAKLVEHADRQIFEILGFMSGHTIKHILAAYAILILVRMQPQPTYSN